MRVYIISRNGSKTMRFPLAFATYELAAQHIIGEWKSISQEDATLGHATAKLEEHGWGDHWIISAFVKGT